MTRKQALKAYCEFKLTGEVDEEWGEAVKIAFDALAETLHYRPCDSCAHNKLMFRQTANSPEEWDCELGLSLYYERAGICEEYKGGIIARIGLIDVDGHHFPNLALMRISAYHKAQGDIVEWWLGDLYRIYTLRDLGFDPDVRIYDKPHAPREIRLLQRWCNNKIIFRSCDKFEDYNANMR